MLVLLVRFDIGATIAVPPMLAIVSMQPHRVLGLILRLFFVLIVSNILVRRLVRLGFVVGLLPPSPIPGFARHDFSLLEIYVSRIVTKIGEEEKTDLAVVPGLAPVVIYSNRKHHQGASHSLEKLLECWAERQLWGWLFSICAESRKTAVSAVDTVYMA